jgi:hypothetical protein
MTTVKEQLYDDIYDYLIDNNEKFVTFDDIVNKFKDTKNLTANLYSCCTLIREASYELPNKYQNIHRFYYNNGMKQCFVLVFSGKNRNELYNKLHNSSFNDYSFKYYDPYYDRLNYLYDVAYDDVYNDFNLKNTIGQNMNSLQFLAKTSNKNNSDKSKMNDITNKLMLKYDECDDDIVELAEDNGNLNFLVSYYKNKLDKHIILLDDLQKNNNMLSTKLADTLRLPRTNTGTGTGTKTYLLFNILALVLSICVFIIFKVFFNNLLQ